MSSEVCAKSCKLTTTMEEAVCERPDCSDACQEDFLKRCLEGELCPDRNYNTDESQNECKNMIEGGWGMLKENCAKGCKLTAKMKGAECVQPDCSGKCEQ